MKTLCKNCKKCETYTYKRINRNDDLISFKYCKGNDDIIKHFEYGIARANYNNRHIIIINSHKKGSKAEERGKTPTRYMKKDIDNNIEHIDQNKFNIKLNNLREVTKRCLMQKREGVTSIFPGVDFKHNYYHSKIRIGDKTEYLGSYNDEMDAYHAYVLKCKELGFKINKETKAHKKYEAEYNSKNFVHWEKEKKSKFKGISYKDGAYIAIGTKKGGGREYIAQFKREVYAFHAYVLWCNENNKFVYTENKEYQEFLNEEKPFMNLKNFIQSKRKKVTSKCKYVSYYSNANYTPKKPWRARIIRNSEKVLYKYFRTEKEACNAVKNKLKELGK